MRHDNDNRTFLTKPFVLRLHWPSLVGALLFGIAISAGVRWC